MADADALRQAIDAWHDGLTPEVAEESASWLSHQLRRRGLLFGDRPLCNVLRPRFLTPAQYHQICERVAVLLGAFDRALEAALADSNRLDQFGLLDWERTYHPEREFLPEPVMKRVVDDSRKLVRALGYDMNSMEWAIRDGIPYAIDFMNPAPDMDVYSLTPGHFEWVVSGMADLAIRLAQAPPAAPKPSWASFLKGRTIRARASREKA